MTAEPVVTPDPPTTVKNGMLLVMYQAASDPNRERVNPGSNTAGTGPLRNDSHHFVGMNVRELADKTTALMARHVDMHEVTHALFDMRNLGLVKFHASKAQGDRYERQSGGQGAGGRSSSQSGVPVRIQLTDKGMEAGKQLVDARLTPEDMGPAVVSNGHGHVSDMEVEQGVPVLDENERVTGVVPVEPEPDDMPPARFEAISPSVQLGATLLSGGGGYLVFPEFYRVATSERNIRDAADLLRLAGRDDVADLALAELEQRNPLEREVVLLYDALKRLGIVVLRQKPEGGEAAE